MQCKPDQECVVFGGDSGRRRTLSGRAAHPGPRPDAGFTLVETLVALFVVTLIFLVIADLVTYGLYVHRAAEDMTVAAALSSEKMEELRATDYGTLAAGGSVASDQAGFSDTPDVDGDGTGDFLRRWEVTDQGDFKRIRVRTIATLDAIGGPKDSLLVAVVARR